jgi:hypothetical protein
MLFLSLKSLVMGCFSLSLKTKCVRLVMGGGGGVFFSRLVYNKRELGNKHVVHVHCALMQLYRWRVNCFINSNL